MPKQELFQGDKQKNQERQQLRELRQLLKNFYHNEQFGQDFQFLRTCAAYPLTVIYKAIPFFLKPAYDLQRVTDMFHAVLQKKVDITGPKQKVTEYLDLLDANLNLSHEIGWHFIHHYYMVHYNNAIQDVRRTFNWYDYFSQLQTQLEVETRQKYPDTFETVFPGYKSKNQREYRGAMEQHVYALRQQDPRILKIVLDEMITSRDEVQQQLDRENQKIAIFLAVAQLPVTESEV